MNLENVGQFLDKLFNNPVTDDCVLKKKKDKNGLSIIAYDKTKPSQLNSGYIRSVIINEETKRVLSFSPPKSSPFADLLDVTKCQVEEFIEGIMINLFWNSVKDQWDISTRNSTDANVSFYDNCTKTFRELFIESIYELNIDLSRFEKNKSYSFVLQHPDYRQVTQFDRIKLFLIDIFEITNIRNAADGTLCDVKIKQYSHPLNTCLNIPSISYPQIFNNMFQNKKDIMSFLKHQPYSFMGLVFRQEPDNDIDLPIRYKIINKKFENIYHLRGNVDSLLLRYLQLKNEKKISKFLSYYPEFKPHLDFFYFKYKNLIRFLYDVYLIWFVGKEPLEILKTKFYLYKTLLQIHWNYKTQLRKTNQKVDLFFVYNYFATLNPNVQHKVLLEFINFE